MGSMWVLCLVGRLQDRTIIFPVNGAGSCCHQLPLPRAVFILLVPSVSGLLYTLVLKMLSSHKMTIKEGF